MQGDTSNSAPAEQESGDAQSLQSDANRDVQERREWELAGQFATGLERAMLALRLPVSRQRHVTAEGISHA